MLRHRPYQHMNLAEQLKREGNLLRKPVRPPKQKKSLRRVGAKRAQALRFYSILRSGYLAKHPLCEAGSVLRPHFTGCTKKATQIHHKKRRGPHLNDTRYFLAVCASCHRYCHDHPKIARELGLMS